MHLLYRHGARYPTSGAAPGTFAQKLANATKTGLAVSGDLSFLADWTYKLGAELLTPFGRSQNFLLGVAYRELYGHLLNNFTTAGTLPVFRTESQDRMVKTAENFAAGFFGTYGQAYFLAAKSAIQHCEMSYLALHTFFRCLFPSYLTFADFVFRY